MMCGDCKYFAEYKCVRFPPRVVNQNGESRFPHVMKLNQACGEFVSKEDKKSTTKKKKTE